MDELRELDRALCNVLNGAFDPYEPVELWRDEIWNAMSELGHAYNEAHRARCFPDWRNEPAMTQAAAFGTWRRDVRRAHGKFRMMVLSDENGRPISAEALSPTGGEPLSHWSRTERVTNENKESA